MAKCTGFRTAEDYRDHLPCKRCEPNGPPKHMPLSTTPRQDDVALLAQACDAIEKTTPRMRRASIEFLWDKYVTHAATAPVGSMTLSERVLEVIEHHRPMRSSEVLRAAQIDDYRAGEDAIYELIQVGRVQVAPDSTLKLVPAVDPLASTAEVPTRSINPLASKEPCCVHGCKKKATRRWLISRSAHESARYAPYCDEHGKQNGIEE